MLFNSINFLIFFPVVVFGYFIVPEKMKHIWLLVASYYFYMSWNPEYALLIAFSTIVTWLCGLLIDTYERYSNKWFIPSKKWCVIGCIIVNLGILFVFKYYGFAISNIKQILGIFGISLSLPALDVILPVGISFYTFQALGYVFDVYRGEIRAEKNLLRYALFVSFFPQLVAGPIERAGNLLSQINKTYHFDLARVKDGLLLMGWGYFQKLVIADRIAILVTDVFDRYMEFTGLQILAATILFAFQIYCDFSGYSDIAIGAARIMGFRLMKNFKSPYYATTVSEYWRNWHISLTTWFRDYIYIPLGGNRCGKLKKYRNLLVTFCLSGLWHGASWNYVVWGGMNGIYQIAGDITKPFRENVQRCLGIHTNCASYRFLQRLGMFLCVDFAWLFFRANSFTDAVHMIKHSVENFGVTQALVGVSSMNLSKRDLCVLVVAIVVLMLVDHYKRTVDLKAALARQNLWFRWFVYYAMIFTILIFGIYGPEYEASAFIYFQF